jgi:tetratricopeptide (TPR) repeat protein
MPLILGGIGMVAAIVILAVSGVFQGSNGGPDGGATSDCPSVEICAEQASEAMMTGQFEDAVRHYNQALEFVPPDEQPAFAYLWCERGEALMTLELPDEARDSFENCLDWAGDAPEAEGARLWAEEMLR